MITPEQWEEIANEYRCGIAPAQIAKAFKLTAKQVLDRMRDMGVRRNFKDAIIDRSQEMLANEIAGIAPNVKKPATETERIVDAVALQVKTVAGEHRDDWKSARGAYRKLVEAIEESLNDAEKAKEHGFETIQDIAIAFASITQSMDRVVKGERQAWSMDKEEDGADEPIKALLAIIHQAPENSIRTVIKMRETRTNEFEIDEDAVH